MQPPNALSFKVLTCNVRCFGAHDGENHWTHRKDLCRTVIASRSPDVICFQEMWEEQFEDLSAGFPGYRFYGMTDVPAGRRPMNAIFYRSEAYSRISAGGYWLSETPHVAGTKSWDSKCVRLANWIQLQDRETGKEFRILNTHLDHVGQKARENQARMIVEDTKAYPDDYPQILTGDMNCDCHNPAITTFKTGGWQDAYGAVHGTENPGHTYHAFRGPDHVPETGKMDWVFWRGKLQPVASEIVMDSSDGKFPSDHYFVSATFHHA